MKIIQAKNIESLSRKKGPSFNTKAVQAIIDQVRKEGDSALRKFERRFNGVSVKSLQVSQSEIVEAYKTVTKEQLEAIKTVKNNLTKTEIALKKTLREIHVQSRGVKIKKTFEPLKTVGCYVPGGLAQYPSSAIMSVVPAKVAGVEKILVASPPNKQGKVNPLVIVAADICGTDAIFKVGGAHAIAALAYGTKSIPPVDKIVGPGGIFVTTAKYLVSDVVSIDMLAGPTELGIIADETADPDLVAADLISQSEHSADTTCCLVTTSKKLGMKVNERIKARMSHIKRKEIVQTSLKNNGLIAICKNISDVIKVAEGMAPEHLQIMTKNPQGVAKKIRSAGLVLVGKNTPSSASDYLLGTNHVLPTNKFGKSRGSLSVLDFMKVNTTVESSRQALQSIEKKLRTLTDSEDLSNHYGAVNARL